MQSLAAPSPVELENEPSTHGSAAEEPCVQYDPAGHVEHAVSPWSSWYLPASQLSQLLIMALGAEVPGLHSVGVMAPVRQ